jgi:glucokinase
MAKNIGIDIGGTNLRIGVFEGLRLIDESRIRADFSQICKGNSPEVAWQRILTMIVDALNPIVKSDSDIEAIGIGFPGFINPVSKEIAQSPNLPGLKDVNLQQDLSRMINKRVVVENDANTAAYGEYHLLNKPDSGLIYLGLGTGVGSGLVLNQKLVVGEHGCAMEAGHIIVMPNGRLCGCGNKGCVEQYASATGVSISYLDATQKKLPSSEIAKLALQGDKDALMAFEIAAETLAQALASIIKVVDVSEVVIGGGLHASWALMENTFMNRFNQDLMAVLRNKITITISTAQDNAGMLGAAMLASDSHP